MSEIENNNSVDPTPNREDAQTPSIENIEIAKPVQKEERTQFVQTVVEKYDNKTAGFWIRFFAFVLDGLIVGSIVGILVNPIFYLMDWSFDESVWYAPMAIISAIFYYNYFVLTTKIWQQTVGKMIFGLKVVQINGEKLNWLTVIFRELVGRFISDTIKVVYVMVAFMPKNQSLHDIFADTIVIHEKVYVKNKQTIIKELKIEDDLDSSSTATQTI